ncbi:MAG TPA: (2Fe-2S)-binding protein [Bacilli bacterium]|nr:(2Fe-2S)-binding protein [Bacilli bacterium]HPS18975.1 (2Fe-2S)-binding protein [Bacilli bacterium]
MAKIKFVINHQPVEVDVDPSARLLDVLRNNLHMMGTKEGCGEGSCGACTVLVNGVSYSSCLTPMANVIGKEVLTIDGFNQTKQYRIIADAFSELGASQCGFCTPGMIMSTYALFLSNPRPTEEEVRLALSGNLCRCTGYNAIIKAVLLAAEEGEERGIKW